ncbi:MAG: hypothetical protein H8D67_26165 [Deltaproteobacteria bacterium]|nr:hypothetical protein [Deltaproteobacteria bacterium]
MAFTFKWLTGKYHQKGGPGSGHHGHAGRPGKVGGSAAGGGPVFASNAVMEMTGKELLGKVGNESSLRKYNKFQIKQTNKEVHD